jgi:Rps23 Pro-64 3,4-dihydroxylase Tpa1-like proline 4-hydroxylase
MKQTQLNELANNLATKIINAKHGIEYFQEPYKHCVIDNFFPEEFANICLNAFPQLDDDSWDRTNDPDIEVKLRSRWQSEFDIPEDLLDAIRILNSSIILKAMSKLIEIDKLIPDPYFTGGGLNVTVSGGLLDVHVDGNYHDATGLNRRINAIIYLNPGWQNTWGGEFGIYNSTGDVLIKKVEPLFNRLVIFDTNDFSFHGLPDPLNFPKDKSRKSIILYYYTKESRPSNQIDINEPHSALWKKRGLLDKRGNKSRDFN